MAEKKIRSYSDFTLDSLRQICGIDNTKTPLGITRALLFAQFTRIIRRIADNYGFL